MTHLALPGVLGSWPNFRRKYETPMASGEMSGELLLELQRETEAFVLRRGAEILRQWLPQRRELLVFCKLTDAQRAVYVDAVGRWADARAAGKNGKDAASLQVLGELQKITAHPHLVVPGGRGAAEPQIDLMTSGKLRVVRAVLREIHATTDEKVLITSNTCFSLDLLERLVKQSRWPYVRVDGSVPTNTRQEIVDVFNTTPRSANFVFLLSAKAGGAGLNIVGASRLIIFEPAWNPAIDYQCSGRIWRMGQQRKVVILRLVATATIDELIIQRQMAKTEISDMLVERHEKCERAWTAEELTFVAGYDAKTYSRIFETRGVPQLLKSGDAVLDSVAIGDPEAALLPDAPEISHVAVIDGAEADGDGGEDEGPV
jgi:SNF2 family DNA or RNA helicase